jgi:hypothetical protein
MMNLQFSSWRCSETLILDSGNLLISFSKCVLKADMAANSLGEKHHWKFVESGIYVSSNHIETSSSGT